jgi:hypothetical protein
MTLRKEGNKKEVVMSRKGRLKVVPGLYSSY